MINPSVLKKVKYLLKCIFSFKESYILASDLDMITSTFVKTSLLSSRMPACYDCFQTYLAMKPPSVLPCSMILLEAAGSKSVGVFCLRSLSL